MTHISPAATLSWAIYSVLFEGFLLSHLYKYDRFQCLRWSSGSQPGAFKRIMTYSYLSTVPLLMLYSLVMSVIKYREGYIAFPGFGVVPKPYPLWSKATQNWITPLYFVLSVGWSFEMVTHLEELNFWIFLLNQGPIPRAWFTSMEFKGWLIGSLAAITAMPLAVVFTRHDPLKCEAWIFFSGSLGSTAITVMFLYVLYRFPPFLLQVRQDGADAAVLSRLETFHDLNIMRVIFRFLFTIPLFVLALDGIRKNQHPLNESPFWTDLFIMVSGLSCIISSGITLLIFFPKSSETQIRDDPQQHYTKSAGIFPENTINTGDPFAPLPIENGQTPTFARFESTRDSGFVSEDMEAQLRYRNDVVNPFGSVRNDSFVSPTPGSFADRPIIIPENTDIELAAPPRSYIRNRLMAGRLDAGINPRHSTGSLHPYISNFTSPIDLSYVTSIDDHVPRAV